MVDLTHKQVMRAKHRGAKEHIVPKEIEVSKPVEVSGIDNLVEQLRMMAEAQQRTQQILIEALNNIGEVIHSKEMKSTDISQLTKAVLSLKKEVVTESNTPVEWDFVVQRDQRQLLKSVKAVPTTKVLN